MRRRWPAMLLALIATALLATGCSITPIEQPHLIPPTEYLRDGPRTATVDPSIIPVADDPRPQLPVTVESVGNGEVTVTDASRILTIDRNGTLANIVFSLGLGSRVVGRDGSTTFPEAIALPVVTDPGHTVNAEAVLRLNPSVIIADEKTSPAGVLDQIRSAVPVVQVSGERSVDSTPALIRSVAEALGVTEAGEALVARTEEQIDRARELIPDPSGDPTIAFVYIRGPRLLLLAGPGSNADNLIENLGGVDAGTKAGLTAGFTSISAEAMIRANPDVLLVMTQGADSVGGLEGVLELPAFAETAAGRAGRVIEMEETQILAFGPDIGLVLQALAEAIYK